MAIPWLLGGPSLRMRARSLLGVGGALTAVACGDVHRDLAFRPLPADRATGVAEPTLSPTTEDTNTAPTTPGAGAAPGTEPVPSIPTDPVPPSEPAVPPPGGALPAGIAGIDLGVIAGVVDQRPDGSASLEGGTSGGGTFAAAVEAGRLVEVTNPTELVEAVSGEEPRVVLLHPGVYDLQVESYAVASCLVACPEGSARTTQNLPAGKCVDGAGELTTLLSVMRTLAIGSNKTIIGLGAGATLEHVELDLSGSRNIILRNLAIANVNPGLVGVGNAIEMWPSDHVWIDHASFSASSHTFINIHSDWDEQSVAITQFSSHITLSYNDFSGWSADTCNGRQNWGIGTQRNPALTVHHNVMTGSDRGMPYLFGSETWGHVYNNLIEDTVSYGVGVSCGAQGLIEANVFVQDTFALHVGDEGQPTWPFCAPGLFGRAWFPSGNPADGANNLVDAASGLRVFDQPLDGTTLDLPEASSGQLTISVPLASGNESYVYELDPASPEWATGLLDRVGVGRLF